VRPSVGRIVHYVASGYPDNECYAAIVTKVSEDGRTVGLHVFDPVAYMGNFTLHDVPECDITQSHRAMYWHWPERVD
jgi:hypothetical protein